LEAGLHCEATACFVLFASLSWKRPKIPEVSAGCKILFKGEYNQIKRKGENYPTAKDSEDQVSESMDRTIPYFVERIAKDALDQEKRVLRE
jgi:bisphosphoglycerate-dependent phosphoglycerate mutase